jgi:hypothetical protein
MKVVLQPFEPMPQPFAVSSENAPVRQQVSQGRKPRLRLQPANVETRLFHAL